jgi:ribosome biogenesis protein ENP2
MVFLQADRTIEFHAQFGRYFKTRVPKHGRDITYHSGSAELYAVGASSDIWRLNLEEGRFMASLAGNSPEFNVCKINPVHQLISMSPIRNLFDYQMPAT